MLHYRVIVLRGKETLAAESRTIDTAMIPDSHVAVRIMTLGICGSDVEYWKHGRIGQYVVEAPMIIGHESAGIVTHVGRKVTSLAVGDRVALEPGIPCRHCEHCTSGKYNLCRSILFFATPPVDGSLAGFVLHPADFCFRLPSTVSLEEGVMCEPLSVGVHACRRARVTAGSNVMVFGAGPIGLICLLVAKAFGANWVGVSDVLQQRLDKSRQLGADFVINAHQVVRSHTSSKTDSSAMMAEAILKAAPNHCVDASIECCGMEGATAAAIHVTAPGGVVCCVGLRAPTMRLPIMEATVKEVDIRGIFRYRNSYPACISLIQNKKIDVMPLITHRFPFEKYQEAFETAADPSTGAIKVVIDVGSALKSNAKL